MTVEISVLFKLKRRGSNLNYPFFNFCEVCFSKIIRFDTGFKLFNLDQYTKMAL